MKGWRRDTSLYIRASAICSLLVVVEKLISTDGVELDDPSVSRVDAGESTVGCSAGALFNGIALNIAVSLALSSRREGLFENVVFAVVVCFGLEDAWGVERSKSSSEVERRCGNWNRIRSSKLQEVLQECNEQLF